MTRGPGVAINESNLSIDRTASALRISDVYAHCTACEQLLAHTVHPLELDIPFVVLLDDETQGEPPTKSLHNSWSVSVWTQSDFSDTVEDYEEAEEEGEEEE